MAACNTTICKMVTGHQADMTLFLKKMEKMDLTHMSNLSALTRL